MAVPSTNTAGLVTVTCANHHQRLASELWNCFQSNRSVDFDICWGGRLIQAHQLILALFLSTDKLMRRIENNNMDDYGCLDSLVEFLYTGTVTIREEDLSNLMEVALESDFHMLVETITDMAAFSNSTCDNDSNFSCYDNDCNVSGIDSDVGLPLEELPSIEQIGKATPTKLNNTDNITKKSSMSMPSSKNKTKKASQARERRLVQTRHSSDVTYPINDSLSREDGDMPGKIVRSSPEKVVEIKTSCNDSGKAISTLEKSKVSLPSSRKITVEAFQSSSGRMVQRKRISGYVYPNASYSSSSDDSYMSDKSNKSSQLDAPSEPKEGSGEQSKQGINSRTTSRIDCTWSPPSSKKLKRQSSINVSSNLRPCSVPLQQLSAVVPSTEPKKCQEQEPKTSEVVDRPFKCLICNDHAFRTKIGLQRHQIEHTDDKPFKCFVGQCEKVFTRNMYLQHHIKKVHSDEKPFLCKESECGMTFAKLSELNRHTREHFGGKNFVCSYCPKRYRTRFLCKVHERNHTEERPFTCSVCSKTFTSMVHLRSHCSFVHAESKPFECQFCDKRFAVKYALNAHVRLHERKVSIQMTPEKKECVKKTPVMQFICEKCGKSYLSKKKLDEHISDVHLGLRPFSCDICSKTFPTARRKTVHQEKVHVVAAKKCFQCEQCGKRFSQALSLRYHRMEHNNILPFACSICPMKFVNKERLENHLRKHTGARDFVCPICDKVFIRRSSLYSHMKTHSDSRPFKCEKCGMAFKQKVVLQNHQVTHTKVLAHTCKTCGKSFGLSGSLFLHERLHNNIRPYKCTHCDEAFIYRRSLNVHLRIHAV